MVRLFGVTRFNAVAGFTALAAGCFGPGPEPESFDPQDPDDPGTSLGDDEVDARTFALLEVSSTVVENPSPFSDELGTTALYTYKIADWERIDLDVTWTETLCGLESTEVFGTLTTYPQALVDAIAPMTRTATLSSAETGAVFAAGPLLTTMGADLDDPGVDPLPDSPEDPSVLDQDIDGQPGVTVHVHNSLLGGGDVYVAQREQTWLSGSVVSANRVEGLLDAETEQVVLGATTWWLEIPTNPQTNPTPEHSWFVFQEVGEDMDCDALLAQKGSLFL